MLELLRKRRSIRTYQSKQIEEEIIDQLVKVALLSPTSRSLQPWEFIVVTDKELLQKLSQSKIHGSAFMKGAPLAIVVIGDSNVSDVWIEDASIATINIQLAAETLGLGSCWIQIRNRMHNDTITSEQFIRQLLLVPDSKSVLSIVAIGYPEQQRPPYNIDELPYKKVFRNQYGARNT